MSRKRPVEGGASVRPAGPAAVGLVALAMTVLLPGPALANSRRPYAGDQERLAQAGGTAAIEDFPCATGGHGASGIWGELGANRHDDLAVITQAGTLQPGMTFTAVLQWEWRDWRPGAPLALRLCLDADGPGAVDGESTGPLDDLGTGPLDRSVAHPDVEPALRARTDSGDVRPVVRLPITVTVPASAPAGGELCVRGAVTGAPADHRTSPPLFDISRTLCRPIAQALPVASPSPSPPAPAASPAPPAAPPPPAPSASTTPAPSPTPSQVMRQVTPKPEMPTTGVPVGSEIAIGALLLGTGVTLTQMRKRRSGDVGAGRPRGRQG